MSWLLPSALGVAAAAAVAIIALHFIARSRPLAEPLPTARFVPLRPVHARTRSLALSDVALLLMRLAAIVAIGLAVAGPIFGHSGRVMRVFVVDRSRAVANMREARDSVRALVRSGDVIVAFDSAAGRLASVAAIDSLDVLPVRGSLSAGLASATRAAVRVATTADSIEMVIVSPLAREEIDAATDKLRATWPGRIRVVNTTGATSLVVPRRVDVRAPAGDAVAAALSLAGVIASNGQARLVRWSPTREDSVWATTDGHVLVHWPSRDDAAGWTRRASIDAIGGVTAGSSTVVSRFPRPWLLSGMTVARWADGEPAAVERTTGGGCIRDVGVLIDDASDLALRVPFRRLALELLAPCGGTRVLTPIDAPARASLIGTGALASSSALRDRDTETSRVTPWLLAIAALLLTGELAARRMGRRAA